MLSIGCTRLYYIQKFDTKPKETFRISQRALGAAEARVYITNLNVCNKYVFILMWLKFCRILQRIFKGFYKFWTSIIYSIAARCK